MAILNLGILAHIDAGKTSLTERLLHYAGVIGELGSVDAGSTITDSMELERQRGITIRSAVAAFTIRGVDINLIDTPGHPDFIAEVERVLSVLDGAVLVISAVEGVQAQTRILMRALERLRIPTLIFVNKIDRRGADQDRVLANISERLSADILSMGTVSDAGARSAEFHPAAASEPEFRTQLIEAMANNNEGILAAFVEDESALSADVLLKELAEQTANSRVHPVFFGSAITGAGIEAITSGITELLPSVHGGEDNEISGSVFKIERGPSGERIAFVRVFSGTIRVRTRLAFGDEKDGKVTGIHVFADGNSVQSATLSAGQIGKVWGLSDIRIGDVIGPEGGTLQQQRGFFAPPTLETVVDPVTAADKAGLHGALTQLAEQDPLINLRQDDVRQEIYVSLYGEVQKEVIQATLASDFGVNVAFRETTVICIERPVRRGESVEVIGKGDNPYLATVGLSIEPGPVGSGFQFVLGVELGSMPPAFFKAVMEALHKTLEQGLHGWQVLDCIVTMTRSGYLARQSHAHGTFDKNMSSTASDFRYVTPLVLMTALSQAGTIVYEPMQHFQLDLPADLYGSVLPVLSKLRAVPQRPVIVGGACMIEGEIPAASVHALQQQLPTLTRGEGLLETVFERYSEVSGIVPERHRTDQNPLDRENYLLAARR